MTFPQTLPSTQVVAGGEFWRLFTPLESSGDIFESDTSGLAFVVGPSSDISCINLTHFDETQPNRSNIVEISTEKPLIGRLDAFASKQYGTGQQARILITPNELLPQQGLYEPQGFTPGDAIFFEPVSIDLIQYLTKEPTIIPQRVDRTHFFQAVTYPSTGAQTVWFIIPYYGRRYASIMYTADAGNLDFTITVFGVILSTGTSLADSNLHPQITLRGATIVNTQTINHEIRADSDGLWDLLVISIVAAAAPGSPIDSTPLKIRTSDRVG